MADAGAIAHKAGGKLGDYAPLLIAVLLIGGAIYVYSNASGSSGYQIIAGTNNAAARANDVAANVSAANAHEQNILTGFTALVGEASTQYNDDTQVALGSQQLTAALAQLKAQTNIAALQDSASEAQSSAALQAAQAQAHAQQQSSLWGSIASIFSTGVSAFFPHGGSSSTSGYTGPGNTQSWGTWGN